MNPLFRIDFSISDSLKIVRKSVLIYETIILEILQRGNPCEAELCARGSRFHLIVGKHSYGNYLCIPNWDVGTELSSLTDLFWNEERLRHYSRMKKADACTIVSALKVLAEHGCMN